MFLIDKSSHQLSVSKWMVKKKVTAHVQLQLGSSNEMTGLPHGIRLSFICQSMAEPTNEQFIVKW